MGAGGRLGLLAAATQVSGRCTCVTPQSSRAESRVLAVAVSCEGRKGLGGGLDERGAWVLFAALMVGRDPPLSLSKACGPQGPARLPVCLGLGDLGRARCGLQEVIISGG